MPITQDRIMSILNCAQEFRRAYADLAKDIERQIQRAIETNEGNVRSDDLRYIIGKNMPNSEAAITLGLELGHFHATWKKNEKARAHMARSRLRKKANGEMANAEQELDVLGLSLNLNSEQARAAQAPNWQTKRSEILDAIEFDESITGASLSRRHIQRLLIQILGELTDLQVENIIDDMAAAALITEQSDGTWRIDRA